jgi:hypothetical protein
MLDNKLNTSILLLCTRIPCYLCRLLCGESQIYKDVVTAQCKALTQTPLTRHKENIHKNTSLKLVQSMRNMMGILCITEFHVNLLKPSGNFAYHQV